MLERKTVRRLSERTRERLSRWRWLRPFIRHAYLWHFARRPVALGAAIGVFFGILIPIAQIPAATAAAVALRANLPAAAIATFVTNPLTAAALYYGMYHLGVWVLGHYHPTLEPGDELMTQAGEVGSALLIGVPIGAIALALLVYAGVNLAWIIWVARRRFPLWLRLRRVHRRHARTKGRKSVSAADPFTPKSSPPGQE